MSVKDVGKRQFVTLFKILEGVSVLKRLLKRLLRRLIASRLMFGDESHVPKGMKLCLSFLAYARALQQFLSFCFHNLHSIA